MLNEFEQLVLLIFDTFEMDRSNRRGGENSARFDFSMRRDRSDESDGIAFLTSSCVGLRNRARFDVSRVAVPDFGAIVTNLLALFLSELGVLRPLIQIHLKYCYILYTIFHFYSANLPGVRLFPSARLFGVDTFSFRLNFLQEKISNE